MVTSSPVTTKFFTNKIQSTEPSFPDYLIEVAEVFSHFDGKPYDRDAIVSEFESLSNRGPYITRDPSDFRDEYSAYGTYLGIFHVELEDGIWITRLSQAAKLLLCSAEPNPEAFCRVQLTLFQYPTGLGVTYASDGRPRNVQANALRDTILEVEAGVRLVPFRAVLRAFLALCDQGQDPSTVRLSVGTIFHIFNNPSFYEDSDASTGEIASAVEAASSASLPSGVNLGYFKRNFHIFEQTGLIRRTSDRNALMLELGATEKSAREKIGMCRVIADQKRFYERFNACASGSGVDETLRQEILGLDWSRYYDGGNLPAGVLAVLASDLGIGIGPISSEGTPNEPLLSPEFPDLQAYEPTASMPRLLPLVGPLAPADPEQTRTLREKANRTHAHILRLLADKISASGATPQHNIYVDLFVPESQLLFEVKSCNQDNFLSQIRRGISQLYEYRYRLGNPEARVFLVLEREPTGGNAWLTQYLLEDRNIYPLWMEGETALDGPPEVRSALPLLFP